MVKSHLLFFCFIQLLFVHAIEYSFLCDGRTITVSEISESAADVAKQPDIIFGPKTSPNIKISKTNGEVLQYIYRATPRGVHWVLGEGGIRTEKYIPMVYCESVSKVINEALRDDSVARISIGAHVLKDASTVHVIDTHIPHSIEVIPLKDDVEFKFRDVDGKYHQLKFKPDEEDRKVIMIGTKSYSLIRLGDHSMWQWSEPGEPVETVGHVPTDEFRGEIAGTIGAAVVIKIGEYTVQREIPLCRARAAAKHKIPPPKVSKPKAVVPKKKEISYEHCSIKLPDTSRPRTAHEENPYIVDTPNEEITLIIKNAFPTQTKTHDHIKRVLDIYDYAVKDMIAFEQQLYLEFISVMENFGAIIRQYTSFKKKYSLAKKCTAEMAMMKVYKIYIGTAIEFDDISIERRLKEAASHNFDPKETKEIDTKKGAWKDAKNEAYGKIKNYFDTCIPLSSPHTTNPRVQKTPTWTGYITQNFKLETDENIQKMYDVLIEMCRTMCVCENFEFVSAVQYLKEIYEKYENCDTEMMQVYKAYIILGAGRRPINIGGKTYRGIVTAAANKFKTTETNPNEGLWKMMEAEIHRLINKVVFTQKSSILSRYDESGAKESYYNELINYNEYYDSVYDIDGEYSNSNNGYDVSFDRDYSNSNTYNGYDHSNSNNYNGGNRNSNFNLMNPILMLTGLIFCLCFICAALLNVISCGCCYVFGRYQTKIGDDKTENDYEL